MPEHTNELSGLMVSAIAGGAFIPPVMGMVADGISIQTAFAVPVLCILYLLFVAIMNNSKTKYEKG
jgi:fucose permease